MGIGAQFGGKYFCHDVRVIRLPRHGASCPAGLGVSCSADRQILGKISAEGVFIEQLEQDPARFLPAVEPAELQGEVVAIDLAKPMSEIRAELSKHPVRTRVALTGTLTGAGTGDRAIFEGLRGAGGGALGGAGVIASLPLPSAGLEDGAARASWKYGASRGVTGTPTFLLNGVAVADATPSWTLDDWTKVIDPLLLKAPAYRSS